MKVMSDEVRLVPHVTVSDDQHETIQGDLLKISFLPDELVLALNKVEGEEALQNVLKWNDEAICDGADELETWRDLIFLIDAGVSLLDGNEIIFTNMCCSDLLNVDDWLAAANYRNDTWQMLWNGHPWLYVFYEDGNLHFTHYREDEPVRKDEAKYVVRADALKKTALQASQEVEAFGRRIWDIWDKKP